MKLLLSLITLLFISVIAIASVTKPEFIALTFDNTKICVPNKFVPGASAFQQFLEKNVDGLDNSGKSEIIRLPAKIIMAGVKGYQFSHINKHNVDLEHTVSGIAHNISNVGNPDTNLPCEDKYDLGYCYQAVVHKDVYYQYSLKTAEVAYKDKFKEYLLTLLKQWENNCTRYG